MERAALLAEKLRADIASQIPALNTARSMGPRVLVMLRDASATAAASVTSRGRGAMPGYWRAISASLSPDRADAATFTPRCARATATARPMPELAPVIQAVRQAADMRQTPSKPVHRLHETRDEPAEAGGRFARHQANAVGARIGDGLVLDGLVEIGHVADTIPAGGVMEGSPKDEGELGARMAMLRQDPPGGHLQEP